jgi:deazaflavin-dependent oxidoreductase (nitroreductase family)
MVLALAPSGNWQQPPGPPSCLQTGLARFARLFTRPRPLVTRFTRAHAWAVRKSGGRIRRSTLLAGGMPVMSITTTGRRSGEPRSTVIAYMRDGDRIVVTAANLGNERPPAWYFNLIADPRAEVELEGERTPVVARRAAGAEAVELWSRWLELLPGAAAFQAIAGREIPVLVLEPAGRPR